MNLIRSLFASTVLMAAASPAFAQLDPNQTTSSDQLRLVSSGPYSPYGVYTGRLLQSIGTPVIDMWCDDFTNHITTNKTYNINVTRFDASATDWNRTRFGYAKLDNYKKAAYLGSFFAGLTNHEDVEDLHYTIWRLFGANPGAARPGELNWSALLAPGGDWTKINTKYWFVLSDANMGARNRNGIRVGGVQEQITTITPEPSAILLVSTGLLGIVGLAKVRRRGKKQD